jgi:hypothetical protein
VTCNVAGGTNNGTLYTTVATSNGISVVASSTTNVYYVDNSLSSASSTTNPTPPPPNPYTLVVSGDWCIDKTTGDFTGNIAYGDYKTQTNVPGIPIDGRQTFVGVNQAFSGTGTWTGSGSLTLHYSTSGASSSTWSGTSASCANGATAPGLRVCAAFTAASKDWEGLDFDFVFDSTKYSFSGALTGTDISGSGATANTTTINWNIAGIDPPAVPVPAAAWLFGSGLIGLAGAARRRSK